MNKFVVIIAYFGCFKPSIKLFLESCNRNPQIDWMIFTDCAIPNNVKLKTNIFWNKSTLNEIHELAERKIKCKVALDNPYKLCDLKPMYGLIFSDYIENYEYWGFGDTDIISGDILKFLYNIDYRKYEKINWMGHLCFVRNVREINMVAIRQVCGTIDPYLVLKSSNNYGYDERDFNKKFLALKMNIYTGLWAADIDVFYPRMRCVDVKTLHYLLDTREVNYAPNNYRKQIFAVSNGNTYRFYIKNRSVHKQEFAYIHFRKEVPIKFANVDEKNFIITRSGFFSINEEMLSNKKYVISLIDRYNSQQNFFQEKKTFLYQYFRKVSGKRGW